MREPEYTAERILSSGDDRSGSFWRPPGNLNSMRKAEEKEEEHFYERIKKSYEWTLQKEEKVTYLLLLCIHIHPHSENIKSWETGKENIVRSG